MSMFDEEEERGPWWDTAQICHSGHVITDMAQYSPEKQAAFCARCGESTLMQCPACSAAIRGYHHVPHHAGGSYAPPAFCHACGRPYPWTSAGLKAARELAADIVGLTEEEHAQLASSLDDIVRDTPRTAVAAERFKRLVGKVAPATASAFKTILANVVSEGVKQMIWPEKP
jgi:hypothetical protein